MTSSTSETRAAHGRGPVVAGRRVPLALAASAVRHIDLDLPEPAWPREAGPIRITLAEETVARGLATALGAAGMAAELVGEAAPAPGLIVLTEGLRRTAPSRLHADVLRAVQALRPGAPDGCQASVLLQQSGGDGGGFRAGLPGLARTVGRECPGHRSRVVDFQGSGPPGAAALQAAVAFICAPSGPDTAVIDPQGAARQSVLEEIETVTRPATPGISPDDLLLVTGGGQGITAACAIALAGQTGARLVLAGRTRPVDWPAGLDPALDEPALRAALARAELAGGDRPSPRAIASRARTLLASRSIRKTISEIEAAGGRALYEAIDLSDPAATARAIAAITAREGAITGIVHGAGLLADRPLAAMTDEDVARVFAPKVDGLAALLAACPPDRLRHLALFSSAAARFGNPGQANYAMANEVLASLARGLKPLHPELNVVSFAWGPWDGGMVSDSLKAVFAKRGIETIDPAAGAALFAELMLADPPSAEIIVGAL